mmetsp:Transcript_72753/g.194158  ORF Transcript_72753/g.194158 Transcript_72753/m.194158 type:complete len:952 (+) Transcript_72753:34-2889(+)
MPSAAPIQRPREEPNGGFALDPRSPEFRQLWESWRGPPGPKAAHGMVVPEDTPEERLEFLQESQCIADFRNADDQAQGFVHALDVNLLASGWEFHVLRLRRRLRTALNWRWTSRLVLSIVLLDLLFNSLVLLDLIDDVWWVSWAVNLSLAAENLSQMVVRAWRFLRSKSCVLEFFIVVACITVDILDSPGSAAGNVSVLRILRPATRMLRGVRAMVSIFNRSGMVVGQLVRQLTRYKRRFKDGNFDLDLTFLLNDLVVFALPSLGRESMFRNEFREVARFFNTKFPNSFLLINCCPERDYPLEPFFGRIIRYPIDENSIAPLELLWDACQLLSAFIASGDDRVVGVHCRNGLGRSGLLSCAWMLYRRVFDTAAHAVTHFDSRRFQVGSSSSRGPSVRNSIETPSQMRFLRYFEFCCSRGRPPRPPCILLKKVRLSGMGIAPEALWCEVFHFARKPRRHRWQRGPPGAAQIKYGYSGLSDTRLSSRFWVADLLKTEETLANDTFHDKSWAIVREIFETEYGYMGGSESVGHVRHAVPVLSTRGMIPKVHPRVVGNRADAAPVRSNDPAMTESITWDVDAKVEGEFHIEIHTNKDLPTLAMMHTGYASKEDVLNYNPTETGGPQQWLEELGGGIGHVLGKVAEQKSPNPLERAPSDGGMSDAASPQGSDKAKRRRFNGFYRKHTAHVTEEPEHGSKRERSLYLGAWLHSSFVDLSGRQVVDGLKFVNGTHRVVEVALNIHDLDVGTFSPREAAHGESLEIRLEFHVPLAPAFRQPYPTAEKPRTTKGSPTTTVPAAGSDGVGTPSLPRVDSLRPVNELQPPARSAVATGSHCCGLPFLPTGSCAHAQNEQAMVLTVEDQVQLAESQVDLGWRASPACTADEEADTGSGFGWEVGSGDDGGGVVHFTNGAGPRASDSCTYKSEPPASLRQASATLVHVDEKWSGVTTSTRAVVS